MEYVVEVQPITSRGIGNTMIRRFIAPINKEDNGEEEENRDININHLNGGEMIELPLESSSYQSFLLIHYCICILLLYRLLN